MSENSVATNRKARQNYEIFESFEAGMMLTGTEVKSLREGKCQLQDSFAMFEKGELVLRNMHIPPYGAGNIFNHDPIRPRKLLMHKHELLKVYGRLTQKGLTLVPLKVYIKHGIFKCEIALAKTKKGPDRREDIKKRIAAREIDRAMKERNRGRTG